ncbi:calcium uniporter protein, mitochondrial [Sitodiplosis mosellana]|uniref:calcium uniporter protein, mitochondrial n=1 Tax=Sitodiplosis mosellana TaxID=263140 RepID=UPI0024450C14|nr:calcium uniporter protein, mitochondrial [Sitodiplosis mosellana]
MAISVCVSRCQILFKINTNARSCGLTKLNSGQLYLTSLNRIHNGRSFSTSKRIEGSSSDEEGDEKRSSTSDSSSHSSDEKSKEEKEVTVKYIRGLPHVTVPLPSRNEKCQFALRPVSHNVGDFLQMLLAEDKGIDRAAVMNEDGIRIAAACSIESLLNDGFWLHVNDKRYHVQPPPRSQTSLEEMGQLNDVRLLVAQLYETLHVGEHQIKKERDMYTRLEEINTELLPLEQLKEEITVTADKKTSYLTWVGLGLMSVQFGVLARLTWWEYSWDIMEPVTYFVTYGTAMAAYAYYCLTKQEYNLPEVKDRQFLIAVHKKAKKKGFDVNRYNALKDEAHKIEKDLQRIRDPLYLRHSPSSSYRLNPSSTTKDQLFQMALATNPTDNTAKKPLSERLASILESTAKKLKK